MPCQLEDHLACDSEWTYCLKQKTKRATCIGSCLSYNGGCSDNRLCITAINENGPRRQCLDYDGECNICTVMSIMDFLLAIEWV